MRRHDKGPLRASVRIEGPPGNETVYVGGHILPCISVLFRATPGNLAAVSIALPISGRTKIEFKDANIFLDEQTVDALVALGWTPPKEDTP